MARRCANTIMSSTANLLNSIRASQSGLTLAELLTGHPDMARRTTQRLIAKLVESGQVKALGEGRARSSQARELWFATVNVRGVAGAARALTNSGPYPYTIEPPTANL